eukprot:scaffold31980_cov28-Prasinocladus_malaysianus.AAC.1
MLMFVCMMFVQALLGKNTDLATLSVTRADCVGPQRGLGLEFLRHTERCRALVHVIDGSSPDPIGDYKAIRLELRLFNPKIAEKPEIVAYNKVSCLDRNTVYLWVHGSTR